MSHISFVFPFYNEEQTLPLLIKRITEVMSKEQDNYEMIFVNDASTDNSAQIIAREARRINKGSIVLVNMSRRFGVEESFLAGVQTAQGEAIILMYTDMQDPPEVVLQMLKFWKEGADIVHAIRRKRIGEHPLKKIAAFFAYRIIGNLAEIKIPYDAGEFKLISRKAATHLLSLPESEPYLRGLIPWIGFKQVFVDYDMQPRVAGKSKVALFGKKAWSVFFSGIISFSNNPIYIILMMGVGGIFLSMVVVFLLMINVNLGWVDAPVALFIFLWAVLMLALGFLGLYILKIYKNTTGRPRYIVQEVIKF